jgi:hypothetical protein
MSLCLAAVVKARTGDLDGARELVNEASQIGQTSMQPTLMGYIHYARGSLESYKDPNKAMDEYQTSMEWANLAGNHLGAQRVKHLIADLQAAQAVPAEALAIQVRSLIDLPNHGATFYTWLIIRSLIAPLAELGEDEHLAVLAGALKVSPLKLDRSSRNVVNGARERLGERAFELSLARGSRFDLMETRTYIIDVWKGMRRQLGEAGSGTGHLGKSIILKN